MLIVSVFFIVGSMKLTKIIPVIFFSVFVSFCAQVEDKKPEPVFYAPPKADSLSSVSISVVGDIMCHSTQYAYAWIEKDSFDFRPVYRKIKNYIEQPDFFIGNLETVIGGKGLGYSGYPLFNSPDQFLDALSFAGFDILFTANNHVLDQGKAGLLRTLSKIEKQGMEYVGANKSPAERQTIKLFGKNGIKFALLAYTYGTNGIRLNKNNGYLVNKIDTVRIESDIVNAQKLNPDLIIVYFHFGKEYERKPSKYQKRIVKFAINHGADIILGSHTHTLQPVEMFKTVGGNLDSGFVAYSLGNFISNQRWRYSDGSAILNFSITKNMESGKIKLKQLSFLPFWVFKGKTEQGKEYIIFPYDSAENKSLPEYFTPQDVKMMTQSFNDTKEIMKRSTPRLKLMKAN